MQAKNFCHCHPNANWPWACPHDSLHMKLQLCICRIPLALRCACITIEVQSWVSIFPCVCIILEYEKVKTLIAGCQPAGALWGSIDCSYSHLHVQPTRTQSQRSHDDGQQIFWKEPRKNFSPEQGDCSNDINDISILHKFLWIACFAYAFDRESMQTWTAGGSKLDLKADFPSSQSSWEIEWHLLLSCSGFWH